MKQKEKKMSTTKRDFGSFHTSNVQELTEIPEAEYVPPNIPKEVTEDLEPLNTQNIVFGRKARDKYFYIKDCTFLNHGAFGGVLSSGLRCAQKWQTYIETQPLKFFDRELLPHLVYVTRRMAKFIGKC